MTKIRFATISSVLAFIIAQYFFNVPYVKNAYAADYSISYAITYSIGTDGNTKVDYAIKLTNLNDSLYAASESLTLTQTDISNISVINSYGNSQAYSVDRQQSGTKITTTFSNPAIGQGSADSWDIIYETKQIAIETGHAWSVFIPGFGDKAASNIASVAINLNVPNGFGNPNYASPIPTSTSKGNQTTEYNFTNDQIGSSGINMIFGKGETYSFTFNYPISNTSTSPENYTIAVPPDTTTQQVNFTNISPKPTSFNINNDGDYVLSYTLQPKQNGVIHVSGIANVESTYNLLANKRQPVALSAADEATYTSKQKYWETDDPTIINLAKSLTKGDTSNTQKAKSIYDYLVTHFKYNKNALYDKNRDRKGALYALSHPDDVICQEYVDAYVALLRSIGVPAVFDAGYGNTLSPYNALPPDVLHAWAEYYDPDYGWVPVDPTWGSTSGADFFGNVGSSHFLLAKYGHDSQNPVLVLSFVTAQNSQDNIKLSPTSDAFVNTTSLTTGPKTPSVFGGIPNPLNIGLINNGNRVVYLGTSNITVSGNTSTLNKSNSSSYIFPSMTGTASFNVLAGSILSKETQNANLNLSFNAYGDSTTKINDNLEVNISPIWIIGAFPFLALILIFVISYILVNLFIRLKGRFAN